jgi:hypothetical protein
VDQLERFQGVLLGMNSHSKNNMGKADSEELPSTEGLLVFAAWHQNIPLCRFLLRGKQAMNAAWTRGELKSRFYAASSPCGMNAASGDSLWSEAWDKDWPESQFCSVRDEFPKMNKNGLSFEKNADGIGVGATALHAAAIARRMRRMIDGCKLIRLLLDAPNANINALFGGDFYYGQTVLHIAAFNLDLELVRLLIAKGASVQVSGLQV